MLRLYRLDPNWVRWQSIGVEEDTGYERYTAGCVQPTWIKPALAVDWFAMLAASRWLGEGPKVFRPTRDQQEALGQVAVNLTLEDYTQPHPSLMVMLDVPPFVAALTCHVEGRLLVSSLMSLDHENDITHTHLTNGKIIERSLLLCDDDIAHLKGESLRAQRIAINSCLALSHFGCHLDYLLPKEVEQDRFFARERGERGDRARTRLALAVQECKLDREVVLHRDRRHGEPGEPTGREMPFHWRKGHWAMVPCGVGKTERKRAFKRPCMVRADKLAVDASLITTEYRT